MKILICDAFDPSLPGRLRRFGEVTEDLSELSSAEVALVRSRTRCTREWLDGAPRLKLIIRGGVGLDNIDREYAASRGIQVRNTPAASSIAVAELALALLLGAACNLIPGHTSMKQGEWAKKQLKRTELHGKTLGLIGMGRIATELARRASACGMRVIAYRLSGRPSEHAEVRATLEEVLGESDFLSLHTPLTPETKGMINAETIAKMKDGVIFVNTGRGACVIEEDVAAALRSGRIRCYANDVWYSDPPTDSPLIDAPNTILLPHLGASTSENLLRIGDRVEQILEEFEGQGS